MFLFTFVQAAMFESVSHTSVEQIYMITYGGLVAVTLVLSFVRVLLFFFVTVNSSEKLHAHMFDAVIRAPIYFFDTNPIGILIYRIIMLLSIKRPSFRSLDYLCNKVIYFLSANLIRYLV